jgi:energy-coupling factor transporter ATP-binding protein EcfA2
MTSPAAIEVHGLSKRIGKATSLQPLDIVVAHGAIVALVGHNGAGKTTLIKLLLNILRPTAGEARVLGMSVSDLRADAFTRIELLFTEPMEMLQSRCREVTVTSQGNVAELALAKLPPGCVAAEAKGCLLPKLHQRSALPTLALRSLRKPRNMRMAPQVVPQRPPQYTHPGPMDDPDLRQPG